MATRATGSTPKKKTASAGPLGTVIAERRLKVRDSDSWVRVRVGKPRKSRATGDFFCPFVIEGLGDGKVRRAWGLDSMQALQNVQQALRAELDAQAVTLQWEGGQDGWLGFPKLIPDLFGPEFTRRLERMVERELERFARHLEQATEHGASRQEKPSRRR